VKALVFRSRRARQAAAFLRDRGERDLRSDAKQILLYGRRTFAGDTLWAYDDDGYLAGLRPA
jgi:hypothetical protein